VASLHLAEQTSLCSSGRRIAALDGLRGVAVLTVMAHHLTPNVEHSNRVSIWISNLAHSAWIGVDLFFVLSGFLITGILLDSKRSPHYFRNFFARRILRIFPLYYAVLFVTLVLLPAAGMHPDGFRAGERYSPWLWCYGANILMTIKHDFCLGRLGHFWTLAVEEQFYLIWPAIIFACSRKSTVKVCMATVAVAIVSRIVLRMHGEWWVSSYAFTLCKADSLCIGALIAVASRSPVAWSTCRKWAPAIAGASGIALLGVMCIRGGLAGGSTEMQWFGYTLLAVFFAAVVALCIDAPPILLSYAVRSKLLRFFGKHSYSLYVLHWLVGPAIEVVVPSRAVLAAFGQTFIGPVVCLILSIAACVPLSLVSWHLLEKHFIALKDRFAGTSEAASRLGSDGPVVPRLPELASSHD